RAVLAHDAEVAFPALAGQQRGADVTHGRLVERLGREVPGRLPLELFGAAAVERLAVGVGVQHGAVETRHDHGRADAIEQPGLDADEPVRRKRSRHPLRPYAAASPTIAGANGLAEMGTNPMDGRLECEIGEVAGDRPRTVKVRGEIDLATASDL